MIAEYKEAFVRCYPHHHVEVKPKKVRDEIRYRVIVNGEAGDLLLSSDDLKHATKLFNRGRKH